MGYRYNWQDSSPIRKIEVEKNPSAKLVATIYAPGQVDEKLATLPEYLTQRGFTCYLDEVDGKNALKIARFGRDEIHLIEVLQAGGFISGETDKTFIPDKDAKLDTISKIRKNSMRFTGVFGDIGHLALGISGALEGDRNRIATSALYSTSATIQALFGTGAGAIRFAKIISEMREHLREDGIELNDPLINTPELDFRQRSFLERTYDFIKTHPIQISQAIGLTGNISLIQSGVREIRAGGTGYGRILNGTAAALSALVAMFVPEATDEQVEAYQKEKGFWKTLSEGNVGKAIKILPHRTYMMAARKPLAVQGVLLLTDNMSMLFDAYQTNQKYKVWKEGGHMPPSLNETVKGLFTGKKATGPYQESHRQRIAGIDAKLHGMETSSQHTLYDTSHPDAALKAQKQLSELITQRKELNQQITGLERVPYGQVFAWITGLSWTTASLFNTISSKNRDASLEAAAVYKEMYAYAANVVLDLPDKEQEQLVKKMAIYLAHQRDVRVSEQTVEKGIRDKLAVLKKSPWLGSVVEAEKEASTAAPTAPADNSKAGNAAAGNVGKDTRPWMEKVADATVTSTMVPSRG